MSTFNTILCETTERRFTHPFPPLFLEGKICLHHGIIAVVMMLYTQHFLNCVHFWLCSSEDYLESYIQKCTHLGSSRWSDATFQTTSENLWLLEMIISSLFYGFRALCRLFYEPIYFSDIIFRRGLLHYKKKVCV